MKIGAIINTYNRKDLLVRCIEYVFKQSYPVDCLCVVDNASSDGTPVLLSEKGYIDAFVNENSEDVLEFSKKVGSIDFIYIRMPYNTGVGGGYGYGMRRLFEMGFDWFWTLDDDGYPSPTCLENLIKHVDKGDYLDSVVVSIDDPDRLVFYVRKIKRVFGKFVAVDKKRYYYLSELREVSKGGVFFDASTPWNGTLLSRKLVEKIGFPRSEFFFYLEEFEYRARAFLNGFTILTVVDAVVYHPLTRQEDVRKILGFLTIADPQSLIRRYCLHRNESYVFLRYNPFSFINSLIKYTFFYLFYKPTYLGLYIEAVLDGILGRWGKEKKFIEAV